MNAPVLPLRAATNPIGVDVFDCDRRTFLKSVREFLADPKVSVDDKGEEIRGTFSAIRQLAELTGVRVDA